MFKVGQTVWCLLRGKGKICEVNELEEEVLVEFETGRILWYLDSGKITYETNRTLFFSEPKIIADEVPKFEPTLQKGDKIVVSSLVGGTFAIVAEVVQECEDYVETAGTYFYKDRFLFFRVGDQIFMKE